MARITVEDCLEKVDNRFQLVLVAAKRARQLSMGHEPRVERDDDKPTVIALREIADDKIDVATIMNIQDRPAPSEEVVIEIPAPSLDDEPL